jgi:hypothetical protein
MALLQSGHPKYKLFFSFCTLCSNTAISFSLLNWLIYPLTVCTCVSLSVMLKLLALWLWTLCRDFDNSHAPYIHSNMLKVLLWIIWLISHTLRLPSDCCIHLWTLSRYYYFVVLPSQRELSSEHDSQCMIIYFLMLYCNYPAFTLIVILGETTLLSLGWRTASLVRMVFWIMCYCAGWIWIRCFVWLEWLRSPSLTWCAYMWYVWIESLVLCMLCSGD